MAPSRAPLKAGEFTVLPLTVPGVPSFPQQTTHFLYIRPHAPKIPDENAPRSLFASNLPIDATESSLRALFAKQLGGARIERVEIEGVRPKKSTRGTAISAKAGKKRKRGAEPSLGDIGLPDTWDAEILSSGSGAVLVFVDKASAELAMKEIARLAKKKAEVMWASDISLGVERYRTHHELTFPARDVLQATVNGYLTQFSAMEVARAKALKQARSVPDDDGFITVTKGGRAGPAKLEEAQAAAEKLKERQKPPKDFYRFQTREKKKEDAERLKREFQEDRKRVERMRARRGKIRPES
ncbi:putative meiotic recombination protein dmc1 protein [Lasiodiplodia theobromae]|uniref:Ribosomal RNA-processing protein 7 n=1 Tax=Lasiodiplodia theobromae TaxID=45133 RepID=A0A5N5DDF4_9PEZI|nr:Meiotic recombination protein Dmc1 [Lasiodiplodia theobromae]KAB2575637.1 Ribosomal RNA-processing protein 7 [Lasiodiplodia theobromae]KAF4545596.1 Meiotic recombination protein Dmc1 [Lasiodiplodia theobromae]KAF9636149.1 putative meiotic recombination protein dmc1 protein [Lasiodiplodia theobromae]